MNIFSRCSRKRNFTPAIFDSVFRNKLSVFIARLPHIRCIVRIYYSDNIFITFSRYKESSCLYFSAVCITFRNLYIKHLFIGLFGIRYCNFLRLYRRCRIICHLISLFAAVCEVCQIAVPVFFGLTVCSKDICMVCVVESGACLSAI